MHSVIMTSGRSHSGGTARIFVPLTRDAFQRGASAPRRRSASASARPTRLERVAASHNIRMSGGSGGSGAAGQSRAEGSAALSTSATPGETHFYPDLEYVGYVSAICFLLCGVVLLFTGLIMTVTITIDVDVSMRTTKPYFGAQSIATAVLGPVFLTIGGAMVVGGLANFHMQQRREANLGDDNNEDGGESSPATAAGRPSSSSSPSLSSAGVCFLVCGIVFLIAGLVMLFTKNSFRTLFPSRNSQTVVGPVFLIFGCIMVLGGVANIRTRSDKLFTETHLRGEGNSASCEGNDHNENNNNNGDADGQHNDNNGNHRNHRSRSRSRRARRVRARSDPNHHHRRTDPPTHHEADSRPSQTQPINLPPTNSAANAGTVDPGETTTTTTTSRRRDRASTDVGTSAAPSSSSRRTRPLSCSVVGTRTTTMPMLPLPPLPPILAASSSPAHGEIRFSSPVVRFSVATSRRASGAADTPFPPGSSSATVAPGMMALPFIDAEEAATGTPPISPPPYSSLCHSPVMPPLSAPLSPPLTPLAPSSRHFEIVVTDHSPSDAPPPYEEVYSSPNMGHVVATAAPPPPSAVPVADRVRRRSDGVEFIYGTSLPTYDEAISSSAR